VDEHYLFLFPRLALLVANIAARAWQSCSVRDRARSIIEASLELLEGGEDFEGGGFGLGGPLQVEAFERVGRRGGDWFGGVAADD
jgi:hypothetical protein